MEPTIQHPQDSYSPESVENTNKTKKVLFAFALVLVFVLAGVGTVFAAWQLSSGSKSTENSQPTTLADNSTSSSLSYAVVDTMQQLCYNDTTVVDCSRSVLQDANYIGFQPSYTNNNDGTITDNVTGLMWQKDPGSKVTYTEGVDGVSSFKLAGYSDWRIPSIKELYSLIMFDGTDPSSCRPGKCSVIPFINQNYFDFSYGNTTAGERPIDSQFMSSTKYVSTTMGGSPTVFGVNFADGRIKGYPISTQPNGKTMEYYLLRVRGNVNYGKNNFASGSETVTDSATGLVWQKEDSAGAKTWNEAINYCEELSLANESDWRLPSAKELQSIVDYTRSPSTTNSAAIDPIFGTSSITNEAGQTDWPFYWTSTTHASNDGFGANGVYFAFGRAMGYMNSWMDVHGAGAQRSDPKVGSASDYPIGHGPQGDAIRIYNHVRCVRGGKADKTTSPKSATRNSIEISLTGV